MINYTVSTKAEPENLNISPYQDPEYLARSAPTAPDRPHLTSSRHLSEGGREDLQQAWVLEERELKPWRALTALQPIVETWAAQALL
eukprot:scaffold806_cov64-Phaeocystis_antarctica.AAC.2